MGAAVSAPLRSERAALDELSDDDSGVFRVLVLPHPRTRGLVRAVEIALCMAALPLTASSVVALVLLLVSSVDLPWRRRPPLRGPAWMFRALGIVAGTAVLYAALAMSSVPRDVTAIIVASQIGIVGARTALRRAARAPRRPRLDLSA